MRVGGTFNRNLQQACTWSLSVAMICRRARILHEVRGHDAGGMQAGWCWRW